MLFKLLSGTWTGLGSPYACGPLAARTKLKLTVVGNSLSLSANGIDRATASDTRLAGGDPGIMANGTATAQNWAGRNAGFQLTYQRTDTSGIEYYDVLSDNNGYGVQTLRVDTTHPSCGGCGP